MSRNNEGFDDRALDHLMAFLGMEAMSGQEGPVCDEIRRRLVAAGCRPSWIRHDDAHRRLKGNFSVGNLIVKIPGTVAAPRRMFLGHMDTVPLCRGAVPVRRGGRIVARGRTAVRADNRTAVAAIVAAAEVVLREKRARPPLTLFFPIAEEIGLYGSKAVRPSDLGKPAMAFNLDSGDPNQIITGAIGATRWEADVRGRSSHAGMHPEDGVSAMLAAARAIEKVSAKGFFGAICKGRRAGTANVGIIRGGEATNQVTDHVFVRGECRSHDPDFLAVITAAYRRAFESAARSVRNVRGERGTVEFRTEADYAAFRLPDDHPAVQFACRAARDQGLTPVTVRMNGGLDANPLTQKGIPTVTLGCGQHGAHSIDEFVDVAEYLAGCRLVLDLMTRT